jgi:DNA-binding response OmpR family regulator
MALETHIVVAEDNAQVRELVRTHLQSLGYQVHTADNGHDALRWVYSEQPSAMILDINMPKLDGFGVLDELKARGKMLPVLILTARHAGEDVRRAVALGAKDYLTKPFTEQQLQTRVARLLRAPIPTPATNQDDVSSGITLV